MYMDMAKETTIATASPADHWEAQLRKGCLELAILGSLWPRPLYGLDILRALRSRGGLEVAEGTLYPILNRLRVDGLVTSEWRDEGTGHPRKYYTLTDAGRLRTQQILQSWDSFTSRMNELLSSVRPEN